MNFNTFFNIFVVSIKPESILLFDLSFYTLNDAISTVAI